MLDLKSPEWVKIKPGGSGALTAELLARLSEVYDTEALGELYNQVCHQNSVNELAFVAAPHIVAIARQTSNLQFKSWLLSIVGDIVASAQCYPQVLRPLRAEWKEEFEQSCAEARQLAAEVLGQANLDADVSFGLIAALAGLHGHPNLALLMQSGLDLYCPNCGDDIKFGVFES